MMYFYPSGMPVGMRTLFMLSAILMIATSGSTVLAKPFVEPTLPQIFIRTPYEPPVGGRIISVSTSDGFRTALIEAVPGDIIELQAGATFTGPFTLPKKEETGEWIYIRSSAMSSLPAPCNRVSPADVANMPTIEVTANNGGTINTVAGSHHYRFVGIEFRPVAGNFVYNIINIGGVEATAEEQPNNLVFDRCYIHGDPVAGSRRGILMNGAYISVVDSYVSDCKEDGADSQALACYSSTGPFKIVGNYLEGAGENVMFGGADPNIPNAVPSDIEIRWNHFFKPLVWTNELWDVKNLLEFKNAQRVLVEGNLFENCWPANQSGFAILLTPRNQNNTAPWSVVQDITFRSNVLVNIAQGINISGFDAPFISQRTSRVLIQNNVLALSDWGPSSDGRLFQVLNGPIDVTFDHNTGFSISVFMVSDGTPKTDNFVFQNNLVAWGRYGFLGTGTGNAMTTLETYFNPNWSVTNNATWGATHMPVPFPPGNFFPVDIDAVGFVDHANGDYRLSAGSPYKGVATDGKDIGADIEALAVASMYVCDGISGIESPEAGGADVRISLFPNPAGERLRVVATRSGSNPVRIALFDMLGTEVLSLRSDSGDETIDTSTLADGVYLVRVEVGDRIETRRVVVRR